MADSPASNPGEFMQWFPDFSNLFSEPRNHDLISTTDEAPFTSNFSELENQLGNDSEAFSQLCQFPGDQIDFSPRVTFRDQVDQLQILGHDKGSRGRDIRQHEPRMILPDSGAGSAQSLSPQQHAVFNEQSWNNCSYVLDSAQSQYPVRTPSLPEGSALDALWTPPSIELGTLKQQNSEQEVILKKRHLDVEDGEPHPPRRQKTATYGCPNKDQVGTVEASFFEDWLSKFPDVYPGPEQFALLAGLTQLGTDSVQSWFSKRLRNGPQSIAFADLPLKPSTAIDALNPGIAQMSPIKQPSDQPVQQPLGRTLVKAKLEASKWVQEHKSKKCRKTKYPMNFVRDPEKPYCCTLGCGKKFKGKDDWRKHEERNYPQGGWICDLGSIVNFNDRTLCAFCGILNPKREHDHGKALCSEKKVEARGRLHFRKQHFSQHFVKVHPGIPWDEYLENNHFTVRSKFPRRCGFCWYLSKHWRDRIKHIGSHFIAGKDMNQWDFGVQDDEVDQANSAGDEDPDGNGSFSRKRDKHPDDGSDCSDDDSNGSLARSAPKRRRQNTQHTYARQACSPLQSKDVNSVKDLRTTHIHQESQGVALSDYFPDFHSPNLDSQNISCEPSSLTTTIIHSASDNRLTRTSITKAVLKTMKPLFSNRCRLFTVAVEVEAIERSRHHHVTHFLETWKSSPYGQLRTRLSAPNDLAEFLQSYPSTLRPSVRAIDQWYKLLTLGNTNSNTQTVNSVTRYAPEISKSLPARWSANISSLANLLLGMWRLLVDEDKAAFSCLLTELSSSSGLCHENFAQFQESIGLLKKNESVMRPRVARKALNIFDTILNVQPKDASITFDFPNHLYSNIHPQSTEKALASVVESQHSASPINSNTTSKVSMPLCSQSASGIQDTSKALRHYTTINQNDFPMPVIKSTTRDAGNVALVSAQSAISDKIFCEEKTNCPLSFRSDDLSSSFAAEARAHSTSLQPKCYDSGIRPNFDMSWRMLRNSILEANLDYNNTSTAKLSYPTDIANYNLTNEPLVRLSSTETPLQGTEPRDITFATRTTMLSSTSPTSRNIDGHDLNSASGVHDSWLSIGKDIGPIISPFLSLDLNSGSTDFSHTSLSPNSYKSSENWNYSTKKRIKGRRRGPLSSETAKKAALMRKTKACLPCRIQRIACNTGTTCTSCEKMSGFALNNIICIRSRMSDYTGLFLPDTITSRYSESAVKFAIRHQIEGFTNNRIEVWLSTRPNYPPIPITVYEFIPLSRQTLQPRHAPLVELDDLPLQNTYLDTLPLALWNYNQAEVKDKLARHIKAITEAHPINSNSINGESWIVSYKVFEAVNKYRRASDIQEKDRILELAFELRTMHYIMSRLIIIKPHSASQAFAKLQRPHVLPYNEKLLSSNIINLQLKCEMLVLLRKTTALVLRGLERILEVTRGKHSTWSTAFCLMIVVCSCIETVEIAVDETIVVKIQKAEITMADASRAKHCQELEQVVFDHIKALFMFAYRNHRSKGHGGFNPIRDGLELNAENGITLPMVDLVQDLRRIIEEHKDEINDRAKDLEFETEPAKLLENHWRLRKQLLGRLISKFLREFYN